VKKQSIVLIVIGFAVLSLGYLIFENTSQPDNNSVSSSNSEEVLVVDIDIPIAEPETFRVMQGREVKVNFTSNTADSAHLHGYDIITPLEPNQVTTLEFTANTAGRFELETETSEQTIAVFEVLP